MTHLNHTVIMSDTIHFSTEAAINPYYGDSPVALEQAAIEHTSILQAFKSAGITVVNVSSPTASQDGVYTANWALVRGDKAVLARLPNVRKAEEEHAAAILTSLGKDVIRVPDGLKFSGQGDALACGNLLFCGSKYRSDEAAQAFAAETLGYQRIQLQTVPECDDTGSEVVNAASGWPDSYFYDIDLALSIIKAPDETQPGLIAYCPEAFTPDSQVKILETNVDKITISLDEAVHAFAANLVSTGETVIMSAHAPDLAAKLRDYGLTVTMPEISELAKGGGYIRCTSLSLND